jgi:hypothetical protein
MVVKNNISETTLNRIDKYLRKLSKKIDGKTGEIKDFKEEMKTNLICSIQELISQGYTEREALDIAISRFGEIEGLEQEINHLYQVKTVFAKGLLNLTVIIGVIGIAMFLGGLIWNNGLSDVLKAKALNTITSFGDGSINENLKQEVKDRVDNVFGIKAIGIQAADAEGGAYRLNLDSRGFDYVYPANTDFNKFIKVDENQRFFTYDNPKGITVRIPNTTKYMHIVALQPKFNTRFSHTAEILLAAYWILFIIWSGLNVLYNKRSLFWIAIFAVCNVIGYCFYYAVYSNSKD